MDNYSFKAWTIRLTFVVVLSICFLLFKYNRLDYVVIIMFLVFYLGFITISNVELNDNKVRIRKNYFWAIVNITINLSYNKILSIKTKKYSIMDHEESDLPVEGIFSSIIVGTLNPQYKWLTTILTYNDNGNDKQIEIDLTTQDYHSIERRITLKSDSNMVK